MYCIQNKQDYLYGLYNHKRWLCQNIFSDCYTTRKQSCLGVYRNQPVSMAIFLLAQLLLNKWTHVYK